MNNILDDKFSSFRTVFRASYNNYIISCNYDQRNGLQNVFLSCSHIKC